MSKRVVVAMSGGVDSSVAAAYLKEQGYEVIGITMRFWGDKNRCCTPEDVEDAKHVAEVIGIPHYIVSLHDIFKEKVVDYFISEYVNGRTPNPCAVCNPTIKFGKLLQKAQELGADYLATGHYAEVIYDKRRKRYLLKRNPESVKDQTYFMARLTQDMLSHILLPLGQFSKDEIRKMAEKYNLPVASKSDSQEVCFVPEGELIQFIKKYSPENKSGVVKDPEGNIVGEHQGIYGYTIGQRKGLGIALGTPVYVTKIDANDNTIYLGSNNDLLHDTMIVSDPNWIAIDKLNDSIEADVRIRHNHKPAPAEIIPDSEKKLVVRFKEPQRAITPGQLAAFYQEDILLGSAWIEKAVIGD